MRNSILVAIAAVVAKVTGASGYVMSEEHGQELLDSLHNYETLSDEHSGRHLTSGLESHKHTVRAFGTDYDLELERMQVYSDDFQHVFVDEHGNKQVDHDVETDCLYRGKVQGDPKSSVVYSLCGGAVHGKISSGDTHLHIQTMATPPGLRRLGTGPEMTVAFTSRDLKGNGKRRSCPGSVSPKRRLLEEEEESSHKVSKSQSLRKSNENAKVTHARNLAGATNPADNRYLQLLVVNSASRQRRRGFSVVSHTTMILGLVQDLYDSMYEDYGGKAIVIRVTGMYTYTGTEPAALNINIDDPQYEVGGLLTNFDAWMEDETGLPTHDLRHMLVGTDFYYATGSGNDDTVIGLAHNPAVCRSSSFSGVTQSTSIFNQDIANTMAHEVGHNLGMNHDDTNNPYDTGANPCNKNNVDEVMSASAAPGAELKWSHCSDKTLQKTITDTSCMNSDGPFITGSPVCGNGIVEAGEDCDCPFNDCSTYDPCCTSTCEFASGAVCSSLDACCTDTCEVAAAGKVCRAELHPECDVEEVCDGTLAACPNDIRDTDGKECTDVDSENVINGVDAEGGACFRGDCKGRNRQCATLGAQFKTAYTKQCGTIDCVSQTERRSQPGNVWENGTPCCDGNEDCDLRNLGAIDPLERKLCYLNGNDFQCIKAKDIPLEGANNCTNGVQDVLETDVDCGGSTCYPCQAGANCLIDFDCAYPSACNLTGVDTGSNGTEPLYGTCTEVPPPVDYCGTWCPSFLRDIVNWAVANPVLAGFAGFGTFLFLCVFCAWICYTPKPQGSGKVMRRRPEPVPEAIAVGRGL